MISNKGIPPQVALIGVSGYATVYVDWLLAAQAENKVQIVALSVLPSDRKLPIVKRFVELGAEIVDDYPQLFAEGAPRIDLCYIPTGIQWHARMAICAMRAGANVLVEKPLAGSNQDVAEVQAVEKETGRWVAVGFQDMYTEQTASLKQKLIDGVIGEVEAVAMLGAWPRPTSYYERNHWAGKLFADEAQVLDSPFNNAFAHFLNLSLYLAGPSPELSSTVTVDSADLYRAHSIESFDTAVVTAQSSSGTRFWFGASHACAEAIEPIIRIVGSEGHVEWSHEGSCTITTKDGRSETHPVPKYATTRGRMFDNVIERLESPEARICDTGIAKCHTHLIEQIHAASDVQTVKETQVTLQELEDNGGEVPAIAGIEQRLREAFEELAPMGGIECHAAKL